MSGTIPAELDPVEAQPAVLTKGVSLPVVFADTALAVQLRKGLSLPVEFVPRDAVPALMAQTIINGTPGTPGGYSSATFAVSGAVVSNSKNRITANGVALTLPAAPADFDEVLVTAESAYTGCSIVPGAGKTVNGLTPAGTAMNIDIAPCAFWLIYNATTSNWFMTGLKT